MHSVKGYICFSKVGWEEEGVVWQGDLHAVVLRENHRPEDPKPRSQLGNSTYGASLCTEREGVE